MADQKKAAKEPAKQPKARKKPPPRDSLAIQLRTEQIVRYRLAYEWSWAKIAQKVGMTPDGVRKAYLQVQDGLRTAMLSEDSVDVMLRKLISIRHSRQKLLEAMDAAAQPEVCQECGKECGHMARPGVVVGAARATTDADVAELTSRQLVGMLPRDLFDMRNVIDGRKMMDAFVDVLQEEFTDEVAQRVLDKFLARIEDESPAALPPAVVDAGIF